MEIIQRTIYKAKNGREFDSFEACKQHEITLEIDDYLNTEELYWPEIEPWDVAEYLVSNSKDFIKLLQRLEDVE